MGGLCRIATRYWIACAIIFASPIAQGGYQQLPTHFAPLILSESSPFVFDPLPFTAEDFEIDWDTEPISELEFSFQKGSLQWVRVHSVMVLPRARLQVELKNASEGSIRHNGFLQPFVKDTQSATLLAEMPIALMAGTQNPIEIEVIRNGKRYTGSLSPRLRKANRSPRVAIDHTCSKFGMEVQNLKLAQSWAFVSCRLVWMQDDAGYVPSLEIFLYWDNVGQKIRINGSQTHSSSVSIWPLRVRGSTRSVKFQSSDQSFELTYFLPKRLHSAFFGLGIGPYAYNSTPVGDSRRSAMKNLAGVLTLYGSMFLTDDLRTVLFTAMPLHQRFFMDTGIYLMTEQAKLIDERLSFRLLLGGHVLSFAFEDTRHFRLSFPQGFELVFQDFPYRKQYISAGSFIYPLIRGRSYINLWARWGNRSYFVEFNYIGWEEPAPGGSVSAEVWGISVGFPLFSFM